MCAPIEITTIHSLIHEDDAIALTKVTFLSFLVTSSCHILVTSYQLEAIYIEVYQFNSEKSLIGLPIL